MSPMPLSRTHPVTFRLSRSGSLTENLGEAQSAMEAFASSAYKLDPVIVMARVDGAIVQYLMVRDSGNLPQVTKAMKEAVSARLVQLPDDEELALDPRGLVKLSVPWFRQQTGRATQSGQDPYLVAKRVSAALVEDGQWVAVSFRRPSGRETARWREFKRSHGVDIHHSMERESVLASFTAGGGDRVANEDALDAAAASMPGFDEMTRTVRVSPRAQFVRAAVLGVLFSVLGVAAGMAATWGVFELAPLSLEYTGFNPILLAGPFAAVLTAVGVTAGVLVALACIVSGLWALRSDVPVVRPRRRLIPASRPKSKKVDDEVEKTPGDRPLRRDVFKLGPAAFVGIAAPHVGTESGASSTMERTAPSALTRRVGTLIGLDHRGSRVHLPAVSTYEGTAIVGGPGTGKTQYQVAEWAHQLSERVSPSGLPSFPGRRNAMVFFDTKGDTWIALKRWCDLMGVPAVVIHVADDPWMSLDAQGQPVDDPMRRANSPVVDVLAVHGDADRRARYVADMMKETLDEGDVRGQSLESLTKVFTGAFATTDAMVEEARAAAQAQGVPFIPLADPVTPVSVAHAYLGDPDPRAGELIYQQLAAQAQMDLSEGRSTSDAVLGAQALSSFYGDGVSVAVRRNLMQAPRNKISLMQTARHFWDTSDNSSLVGSPRPGGAAWIAQQEDQRVRAASDSGVAAADASSGFSTVEEDEPAVGFASFASFSSDGASPEDTVSPGEPDVDDDWGMPEVEAAPDHSSVAHGRRVFTWDELLRENQVVIVNSGVAPESGTEMPVSAAKLVTSITFFSLVNAIRRSCRGWRDEGRRVTVMADELSMVAEDNVEMIEWLRDKGRGFGVELSLATQRQAQLPEKVKSSFLGFGTLIAFTQDNEKVAAELAANLAGDGSKWEKEDIVNLPQFHAAVRTRTDHRLPAFTVQMANFEADRERFGDFQSGTARLPGERGDGERR